MKFCQQNSFCRTGKIFIPLGIYFNVLLGYIFLFHFETKAYFLLVLLLLCWALRRGWVTIPLYFIAQAFCSPGCFPLVFSLFGPSAVAMLRFLIKMRCSRSSKHPFIQAQYGIIHHGWLPQLPSSTINSTADMALAVKGNLGRKHLVHSLLVCLGKELCQSVTLHGDKNFRVWV